MVEKAWRELESAGHVAAAVGEQREEAAAKFVFLFLARPGLLHMGWRIPNLG